MTTASRDRTTDSPSSDPLIPLLERRFGDGCGGCLADDEFACWEMRASASGRAGEDLAIDGGARVERLDPASGRVRASRYAVGAGPSATGPLLRGELADDREGWRHLAGALAERVETLRSAASVASGGASGAREPVPSDPRPRIAVDVRLRARVMRGGTNEDPHAEVESSLRFVVLSPRRGRPLAEVVLRGLDHAPRELRDTAAALLERARAASSRQPREGSGPEAPASRAGPIVLLPPAAAWWVHEMSHAAFEQLAPDLPDANRGVRIIESPALGPWPAGFLLDDSGAAARTGVLWGGRGSDPLDAGHRRRASIRDDAVPGPAVTRLEADPGSGHSIGELAEGTLAVTSVRAGRLDPLSRRVLLHADGLAIFLSGAFRSCAGEGVVMAGVDEGWRGVRVLRDGPPPTLISALCTRQGRSCPVMVGAPTLLLDSIRFIAS